MREYFAREEGRLQPAHEEKMIKLCRDCKHYYHNWNIDEHHCYAGAKKVIDPVTGQTYWSGVVKNTWLHRDKLRAYDSACGPDGKLWEQKPKRWWQVWKTQRGNQ